MPHSSTHPLPLKTLRNRGAFGIHDFMHRLPAPCYKASPGLFPAHHWTRGRAHRRHEPTHTPTAHVSTRGSGPRRDARPGLFLHAHQQPPRHAAHYTHKHRTGEDGAAPQQRRRRVPAQLTPCTTQRTARCCCRRRSAQPTLLAPAVYSSLCTGVWCLKAG